jgi:hypothetical protein
VTAGITRLGGFQLSNGGMAYWLEGTVADDWSTSYTGHFMIKQRKRYFLPINFKTKWISSAKKKPNSGDLMWKLMTL